jgi:hypothetical protein
MNIHHAAKTTMTTDQALTLRAGWISEIKRLDAQSTRYLRAVADTLVLDTAGWTRDEMISMIIEARYPVATLNEAIHVLHHGPDSSALDVCEWCNSGEDLAAARRLTGGAA